MIVSQIDSGMVSLIIAVITYIAIVVTMRNKIQEHENEIKEIKSTTEKIKEKTLTSISAEQVRNEFVSKEMFKQLEKHIDEKFKSIDEMLREILETIRGK